MPKKATRQRANTATTHIFFVLNCIVSSFALGNPTWANRDPALVCDAAAQTISQESGVPISVLRAITRTETGRGAQLRPWPWTVNMEGEGVWFDTAQQARVYVFRHFKLGARSFDVGCFQLNYKWHGQAFNSIEEMFDPVMNARYAAKFLNQLHAELGDWTKAAGAYHSRTQKFAKRYIARYAKIHATLAPSEGILVNRSDFETSDLKGLSRTNWYPLLRAREHPAARGSLVPLGNTSGQSIFPQGEKS